MGSCNVVNCLWMGSPKLSNLELLTLKSFTSMNVEIHLWHYDPIVTEIPKEVLLKNANEIIPREKTYKTPKKMMLGFGGGTYVGFSDVFRYKVLYEHGGWWSDMDVTLLKPIEDITDDYWFRNHGVLSTVGNIMKVPKQSELMKKCYDQASEEMNENQDDWHHAIRILCYHIENLGLSKFIHKKECNLDRMDWLSNFITEPGTLDLIPDQWRFIHWMNSNMPKNYDPESVLGKLMRKYELNKAISFL